MNAWAARAIGLGLDWLWLVSGVLALAASAFLASRRLSLATWEAALKGRRRASLIVFGAVVPALLILFKASQYYAFHLLWDSANMGHLVWNLAHGYGLTSSMIGERSYLSIHFAFTLALLAPIMRLWPSLLLLTTVHGASMGSAVLAAYLLGEKLGRRPLMGWLGALLTISSPLFHGATISVVDNSIFAFPLFLWSAYLWESGRRAAALISGLLLLTTREQVPFLIAGLGPYVLFSGARTRRRLFWAAGLVAGGALLFIGEMAVIRAACAGADEFGGNWGMFGGLGGAPGAILRNAARRPWLFTAQLVSPPEKLWTVLRTLGGAGFLPLASGWAMSPAVAAWLPQQLADSAFDYHSLHGHYGAIVGGPLLWSALKGLCRLDRRSRDDGRRRLLISWTLIFIGAGFLSPGGFAPPERTMPSAWATAVPHAAACIPDDAKLWCDEYLTPQFALRRHLRALPRGPNPFFETALFVPDRVLFSTYWLRAARPQTAARILGFLNERGFVRVFAEADLVVLADPAALDRPTSRVERISSLAR